MNRPKSPPPRRCQPVRSTGRLLLALPATLALVGTLGCPKSADPAKDNDVKTNAAAAASPSKGNPGTTTATTLKKPVVNAFTFNQESSKVGFVAQRISGPLVANFEMFTGLVTLTDGKLTAVSLSIDADSLKTNDVSATQFIKTEEFLAVDRNPQISFTSESVTVENEEMQSYLVHGRLTARGMSRKVSIPVKANISTDGASGTGSLVIRRHDFGLTYSGKGQAHYEPAVELRFEINSLPQ